MVERVLGGRVAQPILEHASESLISADNMVKLRATGHVYNNRIQSEVLFTPKGSV